jgi:hypothetical protein
MQSLLGNSAPEITREPNQDSIVLFSTQAPSNFAVNGNIKQCGAVDCSFLFHRKTPVELVRVANRYPRIAARRRANSFVSNAVSFENADLVGDAINIKRLGIASLVCSSSSPDVRASWQNPAEGICAARA